MIRLPLVFLASLLAKAMALSSIHDSNRRSFLVSVGTLIQASPAFALDMDAFVNKELQSNTKTEMSKDEGLCKYGAPGPARGAACERVGLKTGVVKNGVDAYGNIDRGDYVKCKTEYPMIDGKYVKTVTCS